MAASRLLTPAFWVIRPVGHHLVRSSRSSPSPDTGWNFPFRADGRHSQGSSDLLAVLSASPAAISSNKTPTFGSRRRSRTV